MINALNFFVFFALIFFLVVLFLFLNKHFQRKKILEGEKREVEPLADAIDYAHKKGIIHKDIKPSNIIILENGTPKLMDFGTAKMLHQDTGYSQYVCGTPDYMAPEQMAGEEVTKSADIYSFALLIYEMFFGFIPPLSEREKINICYFNGSRKKKNEQDKII